ncbi:FAST kinase domain-containing protein 5, mitochondrial-like [Asterias amurensis]|uniref:FAST kinase domain-containing protein 5, mitochondrial-like n=1 Tax=Asterias amurensis TaxID=7602 RepID=UPI003AB1AD7F
MLARLCRLAGSEPCTTILRRNHHLNPKNSRWRSISNGIKDKTPPSASHLATCSFNPILTPCRLISSAAPLWQGVNDIKRKPVKRHRQPINVSSLLESVFETKLKTDDPSSSDNKYVHRYPNSNPRRRFLSDSVEYRSSSLEVFKLQQQRCDNEDLERIKNFVADSSRKISSYSSSELMDIISSLSRAPMSKISSDFFSVALLDLSSYACGHVSDCTQEEFVDILVALYKMHAEVSLQELEAIEKECIKRLKSWDVNTSLFVSDWWIITRRKPTTFQREALNTLSSKVENLTLQNIIQVFYLIGEWQFVPSEDFFQKLADFVERHIDSLSWNEIGVICNAFLKSRSRILSRSLQQAIKPRVSKELHNNDMDHYNLISTIRFFSRSYFHDWDLFEDIARSVTPRIQEMAFLGPPHIAAAFAKVRHFNQPLMDAIADQAFQTADYIRFKDIWLLLWAFCRLNYQPVNSKQFFQGLIYQMLGKPEQLSQPFLFLKSLVSLTFIEQYPTTLIDQAFSSECLHNCKEKCPPEVHKLLYVLDCSVAIEHPEYSGNRLPQEFIDRFWQSPHGSTKDVINKIAGLSGVMEGLQCILGGPEYLKAHPILPHIRTPLDIEVNLDSSSKPMRMDSMSSEVSRLNTITEKPKDNIQRLAVLFSPKAHYRLRSRDLLGVHVMKRRQLSKIGYRIVEIPFYEWIPLMKASEENRQDYLKNQIFI